MLINASITYFTGFIILYFLLISCSGKKENEPSPVVSDIRLLEEFTDSTLIGRQGENKIEVRKYNDGNSIYTGIVFYKKNNGNWQVQQKETFANSAIPSLDVGIADFNNDGYNDFTYVPDAAARGSNTIRSLFIYDSTANSLRYIRNSNDYPNLSYNERLNCIDSHSVYGGSTTSFLKLRDDSLFCFAEVSLFDKERTIVTYSDTGEKHILLNDTLGNEEFVHVRFSGYEPSEVLEEYNEYLNY